MYDLCVNCALLNEVDLIVVLQPLRDLFIDAKSFFVIFGEKESEGASLAEVEILDDYESSSGSELYTKDVEKRPFSEF